MIDDQGETSRAGAHGPPLRVVRIDMVLKDGRPVGTESQRFVASTMYELQPAVQTRYARRSG